MQRLFWVSLFKLLGWNTAVQFPKGVKKCIIIAGPHTHWLDFPVGLAYRSILRINQTRFLGKKEYAINPEIIFVMKLSKDLCLECSI